MSRLDVVIFGATGFTGAKTVEEMVRIAKKYPGLAWGVAGRSQSKLEELMASLGKKTGEDLSGIKMIVADVTDEQSIKDMCLQARVVANCAGPYRMYGEPVVKAAVEAKTHVVDVSGESQQATAGVKELRGAAVGSELVVCRTSAVDAIILINFKIFVNSPY
ncbi:hypothetical protein MSG28_007862 [Choristoneura fumiferana]|uniref:Uncharacterized protein n=1 Tax=Choristoneura fumiferana TaxID=7141 RepID=A0ACC0J919_CHOFU|nr:hypothetical protein MSG28_007862 [Choristoneura fumiferana]